jgi:hypothetical protein
MVEIQVLPRPELFFPYKTWFFGIYLNLLMAEITFKSISPTHITIFSGKNQLKINISHTFLIQIIPNKFH